MSGPLVDIRAVLRAASRRGFQARFYAPVGPLFNLRDRSQAAVRNAGLKPMALGEVQKLHEIDSSLAALDLGNVSLPPIQPVRQRRLRQFRVLPRLRQQFA
jgi:hypothetical protein